MTILELAVLLLVSFGCLKLLSLPFSNHAKNSHAGQYTAERLCGMHDDGVPTEYYRQGTTRKAIVKIKPGLRGCIVIGDDDPAGPVIVTGFAAREDWLHKSLRGAEHLDDL